MKFISVCGHAVGRSRVMHQCNSYNQDSYNHVKTHQDIVETTNSTVKIPHGMLERELFLVAFSETDSIR